MRQSRRLAACTLGWLALGSVFVSTGCVERRYTIRTDPPGALVYVNGEEVGTTPVSSSFTYYGDRRVTVQAEGFETLNVVQPIKAPWWDNIVTEFFSENLVPFTLRDERNFYYKMTPQTEPATGDLVGRAEELRSAAQTPPPEKSRGVRAFFGLD